MNLWRLSTLALGMLMLVGVTPGGAKAAADEAPTADEVWQALLGTAHERRSEEQRIHRERVRRFLDEREQREAMLAEAQSELARQERRAEQLRRAFSTNEDALRELQGTLRDRMGELGEIFGVVRQVAGDTRSLTDSSLVSAQLGSRGGALENLEDARELPAIEDLETLQWLLLQEMVESGRVTRFEAPVIRRDGEQELTEVVRIGVFGAVADGRFLRWLPENARLNELSAQPGYSDRRMARRLARAGEGVRPMAVDPSRGAVLGQLVRAPGLFERIQQGRLVGVIIILLGLFGAVLAVRRYLFLRATAQAMDNQRKQPEKPDTGNPLGRILAVWQNSRKADAETLDLKLDEAIVQETPALEKGLPSLRILAAVAPLLGLLGTVVGMIATFQAITLFGTGDPRLMADGISQALVTTVMGLIVAIPLVLAHSFLSGRSAELVDMLEQQSAGLVARRAEGEGASQG